MKVAGGGGAKRQWVALGLLLGLLLVLLRVTGAARLERADLVMNNGAEPTTLDPAAVTGVPEGRLMRALYEGLTVQHPETLAPLPGAATRWEVSADGRTYIFHIRRDGSWTNGDPLTAHDFVDSWERLLNPLTAAEYAYQLWYVRGGREYTELPIDRLYRASHETNWWMKEASGGRWRIGVTAYDLVGLEDDAPISVESVQGDWRTVAPPLVAALNGRFVAENPAFPTTVGELRADPYEKGWTWEVEPEPGGVDAALADGFLVEHDTYRDEWVFPHRVGIRALDDFTLEVELTNPTPYFIDLVSFYPLFPVNRRALEEAQERWPDTWQIEWVRPENIVTNGPYVVAERRVNDRIRLVKNPDYWDADNVALRTIDVLAVEHYGTMMNLFLTGECDWIDRVTSNLVPRLIVREDFTPEPYLGTYFYRVNVTKRPMGDRRVRHALALTIDRRAICEKIMKAGQLPNWAFAPHGMPGYAQAEFDHAPVEPDLSNYDAAFAADCERAKAVLAEAGFGPGGTPFPTIEIHYNTAEAHRDIAEVIADSWRRNLGIDAKLMNQEWKVYLDTQKTLGYDVSRSAWIGDYPDPNTFLDLFVTGGENNKTGWGDPRYDELIESASRETDPAARMRMLGEAEAILMEELPILPIYTYVTQNVVKPRLGGFYENLQDNHFPKFFYWMDDAELDERRAQNPPDWILAPAGGPAEGIYSPRRQRERDAAK